MEASTDLMAKFGRALNAVQNIAKTQTADTGKYKYSYADLADVLEECKRALSMFGLAVTQPPTIQDGMLAIVTGVVDTESGDSMWFPPYVQKLPGDPQAQGSALTYGRRYALLSIFGIAPEDDDGRAATHAIQAPELYGGYRTGAEQAVNVLIATMDPEERNKLRIDFQTAFGQRLADLPPSKHGDALTFVRSWTPSVAAEEEVAATQLLDQAQETYGDRATP